MQLIARDGDGVAAGFATIFWSYSTLSACAIGVMNDLYVAPGARGRGLGAALIEACEAHCAQHGVGILEWETAPDNARAQAVYDRIGAERSEWIAYTLGGQSTLSTVRRRVPRGSMTSASPPAATPSSARATGDSIEILPSRRDGGLRADDLEALLAPILVAHVHGRAEADDARGRRHHLHDLRTSQTLAQQLDLGLEVRLVVLGVVVLAVLLEIPPLARRLDPRRRSRGAPPPRAPRARRSGRRGLQRSSAWLRP